MLVLKLLATEEPLGAMVLTAVWLILLGGWLALARWWGLERGWRTVFAGFAVLEAVFRLSPYLGEGGTLAPYTLRGWYQPVQILTGICIVAWLFRSRFPDHMLPVRGRWLGYLLAGVSTAGLIVVGPCAEALWHPAYVVGLFGNAYGFTGRLGCILPSPIEIAAGWMLLLVGVPYMALANVALLHTTEAFARQRPWIASYFLLREAVRGIAGYGKALARNENLW